MKKTACLTALLLLVHVVGVAQITTNVFTRVLHLRTSPTEAATGFTIGVDGREYLITAKHAVASMGSTGTVGIEQYQKWVDVPVKVYRCDDPVDIAVLIPSYQLTLNLPLPDENSIFEYGQDAYFLGFPYNISSPLTPNGGFPLPFVKRALISVIQPINSEKKETLYQMDGYNNPGFSGAPVVVRDQKTSTISYIVIGVISGFRPDVVPVVESKSIESREKASAKGKEEPWRVVQKPDGTVLEFVDTDKSAVLNTGIVIAFSLDPAIDLIRKHPDGPEEKTLATQPVLR